MVIVKLMGGLGNQMFQYAFAMAHILKGHEVKFDLSYYITDNRHGGYWLDKGFDIDIVKAGKKDIFYFIENVKNSAGQSCYKLKKNRINVEEDPLEEFTYNPKLKHLDFSYFSGYWQNHKYFRAIKREVRKHFQFREIEDTDKLNLQLREKILSCNSVSIHARRGDYLQSAIHITLDLKYYSAAIQYIDSVIEKPSYYIFTDDVDWAKANLVAENIYYVENNGKNQCHIDMHLMSLCKHHIIANSTFSWWAAWLNNNSNKIVVVPKKWYNHQKDISGLLLKDWITI